MHFLKQLSNPNYAQHLALITEYNHYTYAELDQLSDICAQLLLNNAIDSNATLLLCFQNQSMQLIASIAALKIGACHLSLQAGGSLDKKNQLVAQAKINFLITDFSLALNCKQINIHLHALKEISEKNVHSKPRYLNINAHNLALIVPGSGTTGVSKLIGINYENLEKLISRDLLARHILENEHHLSFTPIEFYTAKRRNLACLEAGACIVLREQFNTNLLQFLENYSIEHISFASSHAKELVNINPITSKKLFSHTKTLFLGGSPISEKLRTLIKNNISEHLFIAYGTNEVGECCIADTHLQKHYENCLGKPLAGVRLEIVDDNRQVLEKNKTGHVRINAKGMYSAYINHDNKENVPASEWFYPGDFALLNDDGILIFKGRSDDAITYHGTMIYPREIEQHLEAIQEVDDVAAFALDSEDNQIPAVVFTASRPLNIKNVETYLKNKLGWLAPQFIQQVEVMPKNEAGKILKKEIKQKIIKELHNNK